MLDQLVYLGAVLIAVSIPLLYWYLYKRRSQKAKETLKLSIERGQDEPVSLHPWIDPKICIGSGACVRACPETTVLGLVDNRGYLISPSKCIGHGMCQATCPVDAITLVFGTEKRGVDIPHVSGTFESNIPGLYIAGELGGMGLIRNAVTQGVQAVTNISKSLSSEIDNNIYDLVIVGAGPAGIGAALQAKSQNLNFILIDQEDLGGTILNYPRKKLVMTSPLELPIVGTLKYKEVPKEKLLEVFHEIFNSVGLSVIDKTRVTDIQKINSHFEVTTSQETYLAKRVLLATGRRGSPRKLGVPGEKSAKVAYRLIEPEKYCEMKIMVVGGGDSAVEAAVALSEQPGNIVHLSYRRDNIFRIKDANRHKLEEVIAKGKVTPLYSSEVKQINKNSVIIHQAEDEITLPNDQVFIFAGGELPVDFLKKIGIEFTRKFGEA